MDVTSIINLKVPDMIHNIIPPNFFKPTVILVPKVSHIFLTFVVKFGVNIPNTYEEISGNVAWKSENVVTILTINYISSISSYYFQTRYKFAVFFIVDEIFR